MISMLGEQGFVFSYLWQSTAFLAAGLGVSFALRRRPSRAHHVLLLAIVAAIAAPLGTASVKRLGVGVLAANPAVEPGSAIEAAAVVHPVQVQPANTATTTTGPPLLAGETAGRGYRERVAWEEHFVSVATGGEARALPWHKILVWSWLGASSILMLRLVFAFAKGFRLLGAPADCASIRKAVEQAAENLGIGKVPTVHISSGVHSPAIWCWSSNPALLLPAGAGEDDGIDWVSVISHELAHYKRRDHVAGLIAELAICLVPWQVLFWLARRRLLNLSERACDDWVLSCGRGRADYAESLLDLRAQGQMAFVPAVLRSEKGLAGRIRRILRAKCANPRAGLVWLLAAMAATTCIGFAVALAQPGAAETSERAVSEPVVRRSLQYAAANGDLALAERLIAEGADLEAVNDRRHTALALAAMNGHKAMAEMLIAKGANVHSRDSAYYRPLHHAAANGHLEAARLLIEKGANVNVGSNLGWTALRMAAAAGHAEMVEFLLGAGAEVNAKGDGDTTPLGATAAEGHLDVVRLLIAAGADVNKKASNYETALIRAAAGGHPGIVKLLIGAGADVYAVDNHGRSALTKAVMADQREIVELLIGHKATTSFSPLQLAAFVGDLAKVKALVAEGANIESKDEDEQTALWFAAKGSSRAVFEFLLSKGADLHGRDRLGQTILHHLARQGNKAMAEVVISKGADVNATIHRYNMDAMAPLNYAVLWSHADVVEVLLEHDARVDINDFCRRPPLVMAAFRGRTDIARMLLDHGAEVDGMQRGRRLTAMEMAAGQDHVEMVRLLIGRGADVNMKDRYGRTALHGAKAKVTRILLDEGADIEARSEFGRTALHYAAGSSVGAEKVALLIARGAKVDAKDNHGATPLYEAAERGYPESFGLLLRAGADLSVTVAVEEENKEEDKGFTLLHGAARGVQIGMVQLLIDKGADVNAKTEKGRTPLAWMMAKTGITSHRVNMRRHVAELLIKHGAEE